MILIDEFIKTDMPTEQCDVVIDGNALYGWQIAKPLGNEPIRKRLRDAWRVLTNRGVVVTYFSDLSEGERVAHVKTRLK